MNIKLILPRASFILFLSLLILVLKQITKVYTSFAREYFFLQSKTRRLEGSLKGKGTPCEGHTCYAKSCEVKKCSYHRCVGSDYRSRACVFRNLHYNSEERVFEYVVTEGINATLSDFGLNSEFSDIREGRSQFLRLHSGFRRGRANSESRWYDPFPLRLRWVNQREVSEKKYLGGIYQLWAPTAPSSFGHMIFDNLHPIYQARLSLGYENDDIKLVLMSDCSEFQNANACEALQTLYSETLSTSEHLQFHNLVGSADVIFDRVLIGGGGYAGSNYHAICNPDRKYDDLGYKGARGFGLSWRLFREHIYKLHSLEPKFRPYRHQILIIDKSGTTNGATKIEERKILNLDDLKHRLSERYSGAVVKSVDLSRFTLYENLQLLQKTTIFISQWGSVSHRVPLLPFNSAAIILSSPNRKCDANFTNVEVTNNFMHYGYVHVFAYTPKLEEVANRLQRKKWYLEKCDSKGMFLKNANIRLDIDRIVHLIDEAMRRMQVLI